MNNRIHLKKKILLFNNYKKLKNKTKNFIILTTIGLIISIILIFKFIDQKVSPVLLNYAELEARKVASVVINSAINKEVSKNINLDNLFIISKDSNGQINTIDFNPIEVNQIIANTTEIIQNNLKNLEDGNIEDLDLPNSNYLSSEEDLKRGVIFEIPSGLIFDNAFFNNLGPKIPVRLNLVGDIISEITTNVSNYGINNALIEVRINLKLTEQVILPIASNRIEIEVSVPLALKIIQGTVPNYYLNGLSGNSSVVTIPIE